MKRIIITIILLTGCAFLAPAQELEGLNVDPERAMTKKDVIEKFGEPVNFRAYTAEDAGIIEDVYTYDGFVVSFEEGVLSDFLIKKRGIKVLTKTISGGVQVGDSFSKISSLQFDNRGVKEDGTTQYDHWYKGNDTSILTFFIKNNIIQEISFAIAP